MPFVVHVENFQSLLDVTIPVKGFTVITGTNNTGKSALMRAIRAAFQNAKGTSFIRRGTTKAVVDIVFDDGRRLRWEKGKGVGDKPTYILDGGTPIYPGQVVPEEVKNFGVRPITISGREIWPQFAPQFVGQVFLLDQPGSVLAEAVSDIDHVHQLNDALKFAESDKRSAAAELKVRLVDQSNFVSAVKKFDGLDGIDADVASIEIDHAKAEKIGKAVGVAIALKSRVDHANSAVKFLTGVLAIDTPSTHDFDQFSTVIDSINNVTMLRELHNSATDTIIKFNKYDVVDIGDDELVKAIGIVHDDYSLAVSIRDRFNATTTLVGNLSVLVPKSDDLDTSDAVFSFDALKSVVDLKDRWLSTVKLIDTLEQSHVTNERDFVTTTAEITATLGGLGECPTCGSTHVGDHE